MNKLRFKQRVIVIKTDNEGVKNLANNNIISKRSKYINIRYYYIRDILKEEDIKLIYYIRRDNTVDIFIKTILLSRFREYRKELGVKQIQVEK